MIWKFELKRSLKIAISFTIGMLLALILGMILYKLSYYDQNNYFNFIDKLPIFIINGLGIKTDSNYSLYDFYAILTNFILIIAALYAIFLGFFEIQRDKKDDAERFYYKKPINKDSIIKQKIFAGLILLLSTVLIYHLCASLIIVIIKEKYYFKMMFFIDSSIFLLELVFFLFGILIGLFVN